MHKLASFDDPALSQALDERLSAAEIPTVLRGREVWIVSEQDLPRAEQQLRGFLAQLHSAREQANAAPFRERVLQYVKDAPVTTGLLVLCSIVALYTGLGSFQAQTEQLTIAGPLRFSQDFVSPWEDLQRGQIWRLFTPVLLHFHIFHILFNAFWLRDLGSPCERVQGPWQYVGFLLWSSAVSNAAQLYFGHSPNFGGLSGVVYALIGYLWTRSLDPASGINLPRSWVVFFVAYMAIGFTGLLDGLLGGSIANYCHLGGFAAGALYGYIATLIATRRVSR